MQVTFRSRMKGMLLYALFFCFTLAACLGALFVSSADASLADSPWPKWRKNLANTGAWESEPGGCSNIIKWSFNSGVTPYRIRPSIDSDGTVLTVIPNNGLYALNPTDGSVKWSINYPFQAWLNSTPIIGHNGLVYVLGNKTTLLCMDSTSKTIVWSTDFSNVLDEDSFYVQETIYSDPTIDSNGTIYVTTNFGRLFAINPTGTLKWIFHYWEDGWDDNDNLFCHCQPTIGTDGTIYYGTVNYHDDRSVEPAFYAVNPNGTLKWRMPAADTIFGFSGHPAIDTDGVIYISGYSAVYALYPDGTLKWEGYDSNVHCPVSFVTANNSLYLAVPEMETFTYVFLYCFSLSDGSFKWRYGPIDSWNWGDCFKEISPAVSNDGTIYITDGFGWLHGIRPDGTLKWKLQGFSGDPVIGPDGTLYVSDDDGHLYAFIRRPEKLRELDPDLRGESMWSDPVDTGTGSHYIKRSLLSVDGAQPLSFEASYNSLLLNEGPLGKGWGHNFEARLAVLPNGDIDLHWTANRVNRFLYNGSETYSPLDLAVRYDTLVKNPDGSYTLTRKDKTVYQFDVEGRLVELRNEYGQPVNLSYSAEGRLETITEAVSGRSLTVTYNVYGLIDSVTDPLSRTVTFSYDESRNLTSITDAAGYTTTYTYNPAGQVLTATDDTGVQIFADTYDELGRVVTQDDGLAANELTRFYYDEDSHPGTVITTVYDRNGNMRIFTHDSAYQLLSVRDELGHTNSYTYDADGNRVTATNAKGGTTTSTYDARGNLLTETDPFGRTITMTYDGNDNLTSLTNPVGATVYYAYDDPAYPHNVTKKTDQLGNETNYEYYPENGLLKKVISPRLGQTQYTYVAGQVYEVIDPEENTTAYAYDDAGRLIAVTDGGGKTTTYRYDGADNLLSFTDPLGHTISYTYDCRHNKLAETDARGNSTYYEYDNNGNLKKVSTVVDGVYCDTTYQYDGEDRLKYLTDANGNTTTYNYDAKGRLIQTIDPLGHATTIEYDELDRITGEIDAMGNKILTITYDDAANKQTVTDAIYRSTVYEYDAADRLFRSTDPMGRVTQYNYDGLNRLTSVVDPLAGTSSQRFDADGNLEALIDPNNFETGFSYDLAGRLRSKTFASGSTISYDYNNRNLVERITNARGQVTVYDYYDDGRLQGFSDPAGTVSYQYDANGNVLSVSEGVYTITREYDELDRVTQYTDSRGNTIRYEYDPVGNLKALTYPDGKQVKYEYYADDRLKSVTDWAYRVTTYEYYPNRLLWKTIRPNGTVQTLEYDAAGQLTQLGDVDGSYNVIVQFDYTYQDDGNVTAEQSSVEEQALDIPDTVMTYTYDNRLATFNGQPVEYDADGNMTFGPLNGEVAAFSFDSRNRLTGVGNTSYLYDAENRIGVIEGVYQTEYVVNPHALLSQALVKTDAEGNQTFYIYGLGLIAQEENGAYLTYHYDLRGSTVALTDENGSVTDRFWYGPYGELGNHTGSTKTPFLYNGRDGVMIEANGLYYMRARYYNQEVRRFINQDVLFGNISDGQSMNRYAYVEGNPVKYVDPLGLWTKEVHNNLTYGWARYAGFSKSEANIIAEACQKVDSVFSLTNPAFGPSYHFYGPAQTVREFQAGIEYPPGQDDIRIAVAEEQLLKARKLMENPKTREQGLQELGKGLHALQDIEAHMNISRSGQLFGYIFERPLKGGFMRIAIDNPEWEFVDGKWVYVGDDASQRFFKNEK